MLFSDLPAPSCVVLGEVMMENRREYSGLVILTVLGTLLPGTRAQLQIESVGHDVTLVPKYTGEIKEIIWRINTTIMVEMELNPLEEITFNLPRNRFTINETNGALTIRNLTINDSGSYTAEVLLKNSAVHKTEIKLIVIDGNAQQQLQIEFVKHDVTLVPQYTREIKEIIWLINTTIVVEMKLNPLEEITFILPRNRFCINENNGALTIRNLNINDAGFYTAEVVLKNNAVQKTEITLTVRELIIPNLEINAVSVVTLSAIIIISDVAVLCVVYKRSQKKKEIKQRNSARPRAGLVDEDTHEVNTGTAAMTTTAFLDEDTHEVNTAERT